MYFEKVLHEMYARSVCPARPTTYSSFSSCLSSIISLEPHTMFQPMSMALTAVKLRFPKARTTWKNQLGDKGFIGFMLNEPSGAQCASGSS